MERAPRWMRGQLNEAFTSELEGIGGQVEQHSAEGDRMADTEVGFRQGQPYREVLLFRYRLDDVPDRLQDVGDRERNRVQVHQPVAAPGQLDHIAGHGAETERGAVDQTELPLLHRVDRAAAATLQGLRQKQNRGERRAKIVSHLHHQLQPVGPKRAGR